MSLKSIKALLVAGFSAVILLFSNISLAQEPAAAEQHATAENAKPEEGKFNVTETILEHIKDAHSWHLWGHTSVSLPIILYTDKGLEFFSSSKLLDEHHEPIAYQANYNYKLVGGKIKVVGEDGTVDVAASKKVWDFSITKNVASLLITVTLLLIIFLSVAKAYKKTGVSSAPKGFQSFMEPLILFVRDDIAKPNIGHHYAKYTPFLLTVFFLIWINNMLGLVPFFPGGANVSGNIAFTMTLAVCTFILVNINGNKSYWGHIFWMPGMPIAMKIFLAPIELLGVFTKPISLMIRLFANITAGHILVLSLICLIFIFKSVAASTIAVPFSIFISMIELLVAFLQAFIFTMLAAMYIGMAIEEHHHHGDHDPHYNETED
ncbi:F0F1 ATP synthase subunit A [Ferruginibacter albus]|uniref:F0F1 ATP synthase subunit A n=1 Tax=Ferruginibacter albus TaxID=2875540 RepID=UPI001CC579A7|nr:F0F1 ATP synthase subunit A [Ferruginibacter albus]UAY52373.1 F0F1 ATP synthase subunit A [Ferruginibacter albus]